MKRTILMIIVMSIISLSYSQIINHNCIYVENIPVEVIDSIKANCRFDWASTSHGHQVLTGLKLLNEEITYLEVTIGDGSTEYENGGYLPDSNGTFCAMDGLTMTFTQCGKCCLGINPTYWQDPEHFENTLLCFPEINMTAWEWCTELHYWTESQVQEYLDLMNEYELQHPTIKFVYTTGTAEMNGDYGYNRWLRNNQIREYCTQNNKILFDFADIECWSEGEFAYYLYDEDTIPVQHPDYHGVEHHHTTAQNCINKGKAFWWLNARIVGWNPCEFDHQTWSSQVGLFGAGLEADCNEDEQVDNRDKNEFQ